VRAIGRKKYVVFALLTMVLVSAVGVVTLLVADLVLHARAERSAGTNRWGYRGPVVGAKQRNEVRIAMLGGSTVFGYGVMWHESIPALLEQALNRRAPERKWTVINLGYNTEGAYSFLQNLQDFSYLDYDLVVLYEGYNDLLGDLSPNHVTPRQQSPVFRATGYFPILPLWLEERALMLRSGGLAEGYESRIGQGERAVFRPSLAARASASALEAAATITATLERQFDGAAARDSHRGRESAADASCPPPWSDYCESQRRAIQYALDHGDKVLVVSQPDLVGEIPRARHQQQQQALAAMIDSQFGNTTRVARFALGNRVDLASGEVTFDQMHLNVDGNRIVADALAEPVRRLWSTP